MGLGVFLHYVWLWEEIVKREIDERECENREIDEKYDKFEVLIGLKERDKN